MVSSFRRLKLGDTKNHKNDPVKRGPIIGRFVRPKWWPLQKLGKVDNRFAFGASRRDQSY